MIDKFVGIVDVNILLDFQEGGPHNDCDHFQPQHTIISFFLIT